MSRSKRAFVFAVACALVVVSAGCMSRLGDGPDTVGGAIRAMQHAAAAHDWKVYAAYWDLEATGVLYEQDSRGLADRIWMDELKKHGVPENEAYTRSRYPKNMVVTRESFEQGLRDWVEQGDGDPSTGIQDLIAIENVASARIGKEHARVTFRKPGHKPERVVVEFWRIIDGRRVKWIIGQIINAKEIAKQRAAFD